MENWDSFLYIRSRGDTSVLARSDIGQTATNLNKITDYTKGAVGAGDLVDLTSNLTIGNSAATATASQSSINMTTGLAIFASGSGTTFSDALLDIASRMTAATNTSGEFALFQVTKRGITMPSFQMELLKLMRMIS